MAKGSTFRNGIDGLHASGMNWAEELTVVRKDSQSYGVERYVVKNSQGRHSYAY